MCRRVACSAAAKAQNRGHVHLCTKGHSGCHVGGPGLALPGVVTAVDGREGPLLFPPINPLAVAAGELEESLLGPLPGGFDTRPRRGGAEVPPEPVPKTIELPASRPTKNRLSMLSGERASERPKGTGVRPVSKAQDAYDSRGKDHAASDAPGGSQVQAKPKAQQVNNEETENDVIFSELDGKWCEFGRGVRGSGSRAKQRRNGSIEAVPRGAPQVVSSGPLEAKW